MKTLVFIIVISGALVSIASGIWVAISLGNAISRDKDKITPENVSDDSIEQ